MPEPRLTPEENLLRIIESPAAAMRPMRPKSAAGFKDFNLSLKLLRAKSWENFKACCLNPAAVNTVLACLGAAATLFLGLDFYFGRPRQSALADLELAAKRTVIEDPDATGSLDPLAVYIQEIERRNIFALRPEPVQAAAASQTAVSKAELSNIASTLKLVGIIWSRAPQAIIEDTKEGKTHLVSRAGKLKEVRIKDILKDRVILSYDDEEIELR